MSRRSCKLSGPARTWLSPVGGALVLAALCTVEVREVGGPVTSSAARGGAPLAVVGASGTRELYRNGTFTHKRVDLPDDDRFEHEDAATGRTAFFDIGYRWQGLVVLFLPVHHWDGAWCRYLGPDRTAPSNFADLSANAHEAGVVMPSDGLGFWWRWGGKLCWLGILGILVLLRVIRLRRRAAAARSLAAHRGRAIGRGDH